MELISYVMKAYKQNGGMIPFILNLSTMAGK
jgi:hypothetical protein